MGWQEYGSFTAGATQQRGKVVPVYGKQAPGTKAGMASANLGRARPRGESRRVTMTESDMVGAPRAPRIPAPLRPAPLAPRIAAFCSAPT